MLSKESPICKYTGGMMLVVILESPEGVTPTSVPRTIGLRSPSITLPSSVTIGCLSVKDLLQIIALLYVVH